MFDGVREQLDGIARRAGMRNLPAHVLFAAAGLALCAVLWASWRWWPQPEPVVELPAGGVSGGLISDAPDSGALPSTEASGATPSRVFVHVVGAVRHPGVYELTDGSRVADAVEAAGGMLPDAVAQGVNLARVVTDGEQIAVPDEDSLSAGPPPVVGGSTSGQAAQPGTPLDLNSADAAALDGLPGIGPATADKIVADREQNGAYASVEDLGRVSGIGPKKLEQLEGLVVVR